MNKPLAGIKVLDLTRAMAGPFCTMILGDLGADIIKVESPQSMDDTRMSFPRENGLALYFLSVNRNKRDFTGHLKNDDDREKVLELAKHVDVVVENYRPGVADRLGVGYETLKAINPRIIYACCSGFGQTGPMKTRAAFDVVIQGQSGLMSMTGPVGQGPTKAGLSIADATAAVFTASGILAALHEREASGLGQMVDVSMMDCQIAIAENAIGRYSCGQKIEPLGNRHPSIAPSDTFEASDKKFMLDVVNDKIWKKLCELIRRTDLLEDEKFKTNADRCANYDALKETLEETFRKRSASFWVYLLRKDVPCSFVNDFGATMELEQLRDRDMVYVMNHPTAGRLAFPNSPIKLSRTPVSIDLLPPELGEHTDEISKELNI